MKKRIINVLAFTIGLIIYLFLGSVFKIYIGCPIYEITGFHCPGCGITRMLLSILKLNFYQAFRYNPLLFIMLPFLIFLYINKLYCEFKNKKCIIKKMPSTIWYILILVLIIYGIMRNIFPFLAPTVIE